MPRFNIAAVPTDAGLQGAIADLAQARFGAIEDGYILGAEALAHVTLCQFRATTEEAALDAFKSWRGKRDVSLSVGAFRIRAGTGEHSGKSWAYFSVERAPLLLGLQEDCARRLVELGLEILTPTATYSPHITLARLPGTPTNVVPTPSFPHDGPVSFRPAVGRSTENGVLLGTL
jgi:2'-5' RNA ligase